MAVTGRGMIGTEELGRERPKQCLVLQDTQEAFRLVYSWVGRMARRGDGRYGRCVFKVSLMCAWACDSHDAGIPQ